ncbi:MAG: ROK family protein [Pseudomonadota bacterium]
MTGAARSAIGVDVGGTNVRAARVDETGHVLRHVAEPVVPDRDGFAAQLLGLIEAMRDEQTLGIGIGLPGRVDAARGAVLSAGYLDIAGLDLPSLVGRAFGLPARIENDASMALIAEAHARPELSGGLILMVTVGTGIGGAILQGRTPWRGGGISGQFGHIVVADDGPLCKCGRRGCVETYSSGPALRRLIVDAGLPEDMQACALIARAEAGDSAAAEVRHRWAAPFQRALETLVSVFDPRLIVIGGGLGQDMARALRSIERQSPWFGWPVEPALLGDDAGVIGAALRGLPEDRP